MKVGGPSTERAWPGAGSEVTSKSRLRSYSSRLRRATDRSWAGRAPGQRMSAVEPAGGGQPRRVRGKDLVVDKRREKDDQPIEARLDVDGAAGEVQPQRAAVLGTPVGVEIVDRGDHPAGWAAKRVAVPLVRVAAAGIARDLHVD